MKLALSHLFYIEPACIQPDLIFGFPSYWWNNDPSTKIDGQNNYFLRIVTSTHKSRQLLQMVLNKGSLQEF